MPFDMTLAKDNLAGSLETAVGAPLLATKLFPPPPRPRQVPRTQLLQQLADGLAQGRRLTLISAPAGYGKTTLVGEWLRQARLPAAWVTLDAGDNDVVRFIKYLVAGLQTSAPGLGASTAAMLEATQSRGLEDLLTGLINELAGLPASPCLVILDDYHLVENQAVHDVVAHLLERLPPQVHLVIITRADPPLPISRLRGRGLVTELRLADLRFSQPECAEFLALSLQTPLSAEQAAALNSRAEGWAAGLQMAALALQGPAGPRTSQEISAFIDNFAGGNRYILDYLLEEVMQRQPETIQRFLVQTSILERLCSGACDAVTGHEGASQVLLEHLEHTNLFIVPLDDRRQWYRYHRLFSDLLQQRLRQTQPESLPELHRRASRWFASAGYPAEAVEHALAASDSQQAAALVEQYADSTAMRSEIITLLGWIERLPAAQQQNRPRLAIYQAWGGLLSGQPLETVNARLDAITGDPGWIAPRTAPIRSYIALMRGQVAEAAGLARLGIEQLSDSEPFLRSLAAYCLAMTSMAEYQTAESVRQLDEAAQVSRRAGNILVAVIVQYSLADLVRKQGHLGQARQIYQQALELARDPQGRLLPIAVRPLAGLGDLERECNHLDEAERLLFQALELHRSWLRVGAIPAWLALARLRLAQGDPAAAQQAIDQARQLSSQTASTSLDDTLVELFQAWYWIQLGKLEAAARWAESRRLEKITASEFQADAGTLSPARLVKYEYLVLARLYLAQNQPERALALMERVEPFFEQAGRHGTLLEVRLLRSLALQAQGQEAAACQLLTGLLQQAEPQGYFRLFVDEGEPLHRLLEKCRAGLERHALHGRLLAYIDRLQQAFPGAGPETPPGPPASHQPPGEAYEPLSERELEVLRLLQSPLSVEEIAGQLFISVHTARSHIKSIYARLGAHSRLEAVARAKEHGLI